VDRRGLLALALIGQAWSGYWDIYSHRFVYSQDPPLNPAHLALYTFTGLGLWALLGLRRRSGLYGLATAGFCVQLGAGLWNELQHRLWGEIEPISPPHAALALGLLAAQVGFLLALAHAAPDAQRARLVQLGFVALWLTGQGSSLYVAGVLQERGQALAALLLLGAGTALLLVPAGLANPRLPLLLGLSSYAANMLPLALLARPPLPLQAYLPLAPLAGLALWLGASLGAASVRLHRALELGALGGLLLYPLSYPFSAQLMPSMLYAALLGSAVGALLGPASLVLMRALVGRAS